MKKSELKEIIRKEVREALDPEFDKAQNKLFKMATGEDPGSKRLNKPRPKGMEILGQFPFNQLPLTRKDVDWNNRGVEGWGMVYLPSLAGGDVVDTMFDQDQVKEFVEDFKNEYNEEPIFSIDSTSNKIRIINPKFTEWRENYIKGKDEFLKNM
jgi:hypothetical protein